VATNQPEAQGDPQAAWHVTEHCNGKDRKLSVREKTWANGIAKLATEMIQAFAPKSCPSTHSSLALSR
jgi:hypothetical protein